jgi:hypothetical protein
LPTGTPTCSIATCCPRKFSKRNSAIASRLHARTGVTTIPAA